MKTEYEYLIFVKQDKENPKLKTDKYDCKNKKQGNTLGVILWYGAWMQYCYVPTCQAVYSSGCLKYIYDFIDQLKKERN